jgi:hypothetical protein
LGSRKSQSRITKNRHPIERAAALFGYDWLQNIPVPFRFQQRKPDDENQSENRNGQYSHHIEPQGPFSVIFSWRRIMQSASPAGNPKVNLGLGFRHVNQC